MSGIEVPAPSEREALEELVACQDLKIEVERLAYKIADDGGSAEVFRRWDEAKGDYDHRAPLAWAAARAALSVPSQPDKIDSRRKSGSGAVSGGGYGPAIDPTEKGTS